MSVDWPSEGPRSANGVGGHIQYLPDASDVSMGAHRCTLCGERIYTTRRARKHSCTPTVTCPVCDGAVRPHWTPRLTVPAANECQTCGHVFPDR